MSLVTYAISSFIPLFIGTSSAYLTLDVFVPLTGRIGADAPADNLIATIVSIVGALGCPLFVPFVWRFQNSNTRVLNRMILAMVLVTAIPIAVFSVREPFDSMHQKRVYVMRTENVSRSFLQLYVAFLNHFQITTGEHHLHLSTSDGAPNFEYLVYEVAKQFSAPAITEPSDNASTVAAGIPVPQPEPVLMDWYNSDWDPMFPFSLVILLSLIVSCLFSKLSLCF